MKDLSVVTVFHLHGKQPLLVARDSIRDHHYDARDCRVFGVTTDGRFVYAITEEHDAKYPHTRIATALRVYYSHYRDTDRDPLSPAEFMMLRALGRVHPEVSPDVFGLRAQYDAMATQMFVALGRVNNVSDTVAQAFFRGMQDVLWHEEHPIERPEADREYLERLLNEPNGFEEMLKSHWTYARTYSGRMSSSNGLNIQRIPSERSNVEKQMRFAEEYGMSPEKLKEIFGADADVRMFGHDLMEVRLPKGADTDALIEELKKNWAVPDEWLRNEVRDYSKLDTDITHKVMGEMTEPPEEPAHADHSVLIGDSPKARTRYNRLVDIIRNVLGGFDRDPPKDFFLIPEEDGEVYTKLDWASFKELRLQGTYHVRNVTGGKTSCFVSYEFKNDEDSPMGDDFFVEVDITGFAATAKDALRLLLGSIERLAKVTP